MKFSLKRSLACLVSTAIFALAAVPAQAAVLFVRSTQDAGTVSLRTAVGAAAAGDTIVFQIPTSDPGYDPSTGIFTITLTSGEIVIDKDLTIAGPSAANIAVNGNHATRIFHVTTGTVLISNLSLLDGGVTGDRGAVAGLPGLPGIGGAVLNQGTLVFTGCTFRGNSVLGGEGGSGVTAGVGGDGRGGAIANQNTLSLVACTLSGNSAEGGHGGIAINTSLHPANAMGGMGLGGAIHNADTGTLSVSNCTITANSTKGADGIQVQIASRGAAAQGGGIANFGNLVMVNSTLASNTARGGDSKPGMFFGPFDGGASSGGGLYNATGSVSTVHDSVFAPNSTVGGAGAGSPAGPGAATGPDVNGAVTSQGHNLLGRSDGCTGFTTDDQQGGTTDDTRLDPRLGALGNYGGPTETLPLFSDSPAIDGGSTAALARDQRGFGRTGPPDIGAFEYQGTEPVVLANIATRLRVQPGDNAMIGGFIITGSQPKTVIIRGIGPSLPLAGALADPIIELHDSTGELLATNDNWRDGIYQEQVASALPPANDLEPALWEILNPGAYTVVVRGNNDATGIGLFEVYDLDQAVDSKLGNISTRGSVGTGNDVMIGGTIIAGVSPARVLFRAIGPSLANFGVSNALGDPVLELHDGNGVLIASNSNWRDTQEAEISATGLAPSNNLESAILRDLAPGPYTAIVRGLNDTTGIALVEVYNLN
jgi:hypothetical protein